MKKFMIKFTQVFLYVIFCVLFSASAYAKTLHIEIDLPISQENEALIPIVARDNQWRPDSLYNLGSEDMEPVSASTYISELMLKPYLRQYLKDKIILAHRNYYGEYRAEERLALEQLLDSRLNITVEFND